MIKNSILLLSLSVVMNFIPCQTGNASQESEEDRISKAKAFLQRSDMLNLTKLELGMNQTSEKGAKALAEYQEPTTLKSSNNNIDEEEANALAQTHSKIQ